MKRRIFKTDSKFIRKVDEMCAKVAPKEDVAKNERFCEHTENKYTISVFYDHSIGIYMLEEGKMQTIIFDLDRTNWRRIVRKIEKKCEETN